MKHLLTKLNRKEGLKSILRTSQHFFPLTLIIFTKDIKVNFTYERFDPIIGDPTFKNLCNIATFFQI